MLKTFLSIAAAVSVLLSGGYTPSMTEINRKAADIAALKATAAGEVSAEDIYSVEHWTGKDKYTNRLHGYTIVVPAGMTPDASLSTVRFKLDGGSRSIEIFKESFASESECLTYISYSNRFADDSENHTVEVNERTEINGRQAYVMKWDRKTVGPTDKNHYANIDIIDGTNVYTIMIKSRALFNDYMEIAESFDIIEPTVEVGSAEPFKTGTGSVMNEETAAFYEKIFGEESKLNWGLLVPTQPVLGMNTFENIEKSIGAKMDLCLFYCFVLEKYDKTLVYDGLANAWASGKVCELTLQLSPDSPSSMIYDIINGKYDSFFTDFAADLKRFGHPVLLRLFNEMNGDWCNYSGCFTSRDPDVYVQLYKYVYNKLKNAGAENIIWVWNPNEKSYPNFAWNSEELYYPGSDYVDVVGITGYNTGTYYEGEKWRSFDRIYSELYTKTDLLYNKPMMITEFSCATVGGDKVEWVRDMFASLPNYPKIKAAVWWSGCDYDANGNIARSYFIDDTAGVIDVFKENLADK